MKFGGPTYTIEEARAIGIEITESVIYGEIVYDHWLVTAAAARRTVEHAMNYLDHYRRLHENNHATYDILIRATDELWAQMCEQMWDRGQKATVQRQQQSKNVIGKR
jgi:hypothetical protein